MRACGLLPPMAESMSCAGSSPSAKPRRRATSCAGLTERQPSGTTTRMLSARPIKARPEEALPPDVAPSQSSAATRSAAVMRSSGSGRSAASTPGSGGVVTCPTPTTTGVLGSRAMARAAYRFTTRGLRGASVDSVLMRVAVGSDHAGFDLKEILKAELAAQGHAVDDHGTFEPGVAVDDPDFGAAVGGAVSGGSADLGARTTGATVAVDALAAFMEASEEHGRHDGRLEKLAGLERGLVHLLPVEGTP